jgi:hypothetical protein
MVRLVVLALFSASLTVVLSTLFGIWGVFSPRTGPMVFLVAEAAWIVSMLIIFFRGLMHLRGDLTRAKKEIAFSAASLILIGLSYVWALTRGISS